MMCRPATANSWCRSLENNTIKVPKALWWNDGTIEMLDQTKLPAEEVVLHITEIDELIAAIKRLSVRGAPALGVAGAYGVLLVAKSWQNSDETPDWDDLEQRVIPLKESRPTAINLSWAIQRVINVAKSAQPKNADEAYQHLEQEAIAIHREDEERCRKIGEYGAELLSGTPKIITHCNAGALATGGIGTALGVIYAAAMHNMSVEVYADETRPLLQGARLTAWELKKANIPVHLMTDGMAASLMRREHIDCVIVGADRIAANGDTANKIGTYQLAIAAKAHDVPFYVAAPTSTIDLSIETGDGIPIEIRGVEEVVHWGDITTAPHGIAVYSPAFDVTPAKYITGIITDVGVTLPPYDLANFTREHHSLNL